MITLLFFEKRFIRVGIKISCCNSCLNFIYCIITSVSSNKILLLEIIVRSVTGTSLQPVTISRIQRLLCVIVLHSAIYTCSAIVSKLYVSRRPADNVLVLDTVICVSKIFGCFDHGHCWSLIVQLPITAHYQPKPKLTVLHPVGLKVRCLRSKIRCKSKSLVSQIGSCSSLDEKRVHHGTD